MKILVLYDYFYPAQKAGGIVRSLYNLCKHTNDVVEYYVVCSCFDFKEKNIMPNIQINKWTNLERNINAYYVDHKDISISFLHSLFAKISPCTIYINGVFSYKFNILPLIVLRFTPLSPKKLIIAPHGMLQQGAIQSKKLKKKIFFTVTKLLGLFNEVRWHATDEQEKVDIINMRYNTKQIWVISNIPSILLKPPTFITPPLKEQMHIRITTISLIAEKKNHKFAIKLLSNVSRNLKISYTIYGPIKDKAYWQSCQEMMNNAPGNINIEYCGMLTPDDVERALSQHHFFLLPTQGENFGHAIFEAMSAGLPVIISDQTPWRNLETQKVGWDIPLSEPERFVAAIERAARMDQAEYEQWSRAAHQYALDFIQNSNLKERYLEMFSAT